MTYYLQDMCCLCLKVANLSDFNSDENDWTSYDKILSSLTRIANVLETNFDYKICSKCTETVEMIYNFNESCIKNIKTLSSYKNILEENKEKKRCTLQVALKKYEPTEITSEIVCVKKEIQDETVSEGEDILEENMSRFVPVKVKEEIEENPIFDDELKIDRFNEVSFKAEIEDKSLKNECFYEINDKDISGLEIQNLHTRTERNIELPSTSKLSAPSTSTSISEQTQLPLEHFNLIDDTQIQLEYGVRIQKTTIISEVQHGNETYREDKTYKKINNLKNNHRFESQCELEEFYQNVKVKPYNCDICQKSFSLKSYLRRHMLTHTSENPYVCDICHKVFSRKSHLNTHRLIHSEVKPFSCPDCDKTFTQKSHLVVHQRTHTGDKPYACDVCRKAYTQKQHLNDHMRIHTGERPYVCDVCHKAFLQKSYLTEHRRIHTGERPYVCDVCTRSFAVRSTLKKHRKIHVIE